MTTGVKELAEVLKAKIREVDTLLEQMRAQAYLLVLSIPWRKILSAVH